MTDHRVLDELEVQSYNALFGAALNTQRASIGLAPVDDVRAHILGDQLWLAADPTLAPWQEPADLDVAQTGAWILLDDRPIPAARVSLVSGLAVRTDGATVAATLLLDAISRGEPPVSA